MDIHRLNHELREVLLDLERKGYKKTDIGRLLLGSNGYAPISKFITEDVNRTSFGIKPLSRIAEQSGYKLELTFVKNGNDTLVNKFNESNSEFFEELPVLIERYLNGEYNSDMQKIRKSKSTSAIDELLSGLGI